MSKQDVFRRCIEDPLFMGKATMPRIFNETSPVFHKEIRDHLIDEDIRLLNILAPRGHAKTTVAAILRIIDHLFCEDLRLGKRPEPHVILLTSASRGHSINTLTTVKNVLEFNPHFRSLFGYHGSQNALQWTQDVIRLDNGSSIVCRGMGQQVRGINIDGMRPDLIIGDDLEGETNSKSIASIEGNLTWFLQTLMPAGSKDAKFLNIGTPQFMRSIVFKLKEMSEWTTLHYKAINTDDEGNETALWPEVMSLDKLHRTKSDLVSIGRVSAFYREYQCEVVGDEDQLFKDEYLQYWEGDFKRDNMGSAYLDMADGRRVPVNTFMGVDPASSLSATADYTVIFVIAVDAMRNIYCVDYLRKRMKPIDVGDSIIEWFDKYNPLKTQIESVAYQSMIADYIRKARERYIPGISIKNNPRKGKTERLEGLQPAFARKRVHLRKNILNGMETFKDELLMFPRAKHDDTIDGYFYAVKGIYLPFHDVSLQDPDPNRTFVRTRKKPTTTLDWEIV